MKQEFIHKEKEKLIVFLDDKIDFVGVNSLVSQCNKIELILIEFVCESIVSLVLGENKYTRPTLEPFNYLNRTYEIIPCPFKEKLEISIEKISNNKQELQYITFGDSIEGLGKFKELIIRLESSLKDFGPDIILLSKLLLETGYIWLTESLNLTCSKLEDSIAFEFYSSLRKVLPEKLSKNIWLHISIDGTGFNIVDNRARDRILFNAGKRKLSVNKSPIEVSSIFLTQIIEYEKSFLKQSVINDEPIIVELSQAPYKETGSQIADQVIFKKDNIVVNPIIRDDKFLLAACYQIKYHDAVKYVLQKESKNLRFLCAKYLRELKEIMINIKEPNFIMPKKTDNFFRQFILKYTVLQPNFFGIGIDINRLLIDFFNRKN